MVDVNVDFIFENEQPINADFQLEPDVTYTADIMLSSASSFHNELYNRDLPDQHPMGAITGLEDALDGLSDDITAENNRAVEAEETLDNKIDSEADTRADEITRVEGLISDEETRAEGVEGGLREDLTAEINRATNAEGVLQTNITAEESRASEAETTLQTNITAEENRAKGVEQQLASSIDSDHQAISNHVSDKNNPHEVTKAQVGLGNVENLTPADMPMSIATKTYVDNADNGLQGQINTINTTIGGYGNIVTHNVSEFATSAQGTLADTALQPNDNISELTNNLNYQTATQVANSIAVETNNREAADNNLQSQIDAIVSSSDVFDIVGTYAELQAYDISTVPVNDIIKVLEDSTHGGAATYYRCIETNNVKSWSYIGSEGAYYTKAESDNKFVPQTRTVNSKALSSDITLTATDVGALPSSTVIPTVNDSTVTIQKNGSTVSTFTLNQSSNETVNITVPTKTSEITNDSGYITSSSLPTVNNGQLDIQVNGSSIATFTANQSGNTTADITIPSSLPDQTGNAGKFLSTDGSDASWQYALNYRGDYNDNTQYYPGDVVRYFYESMYRKFLCISAIIRRNPLAKDYWVDLTGYITEFQTSSDDCPILSYTANGWTGNRMSGIRLKVPYGQNNYSKVPTINLYSGLLKVPGGIDGYSPTSAFGTVAFSNDYGDLDNKPSIPTATSDLTNDSGFITISALSGYATESWVTNKGYITGINSSDVTTALGYTPYNSSNPAGFITSSALTPYALSSSLSAVATSGAYADLSGKPTIPTVNNPTITITQGGTTKGSFTLNQSTNASIDLDSGGSSTITYDGVTIDTNSDDELEAIGVVNKNTAVGATAVKYDWIGTLAEYNSQNVETLHPEWICYITDDVSGGTSVYTKAEVDSAISTALTTMLDSAFPVGSRYITEASTCPLATLIPNSTWVLTSQGRVIQGADSNHLAGTTAEAGLPNITGVVGYSRCMENSSGAFIIENSSENVAGSGGSATQVRKISIDASNSNSIYGNSTTVQPPAEFVNIFKRTA